MLGAMPIRDDGNHKGRQGCVWSRAATDNGLTSNDVDGCSRETSELRNDGFGSLAHFSGTGVDHSQSWNGRIILPKVGEQCSLQSRVGQLVNAQRAKEGIGT